MKPKHWDYFHRWDKWDTLLETWCQLYTEPGWKPQTREQQEVWNLITHQALQFRDYKILLSWIFFLFIWRKKGLSCVFDLLFRTLNPRAVGSSEFHVLKGWTLTSTNWYSGLCLWWSVDPLLGIKCIKGRVYWASDLCAHFTALDTHRPWSPLVTGSAPPYQGHI